MTKGDAKSAKRRLADMAAKPEKFVYSPPKGGEPNEYDIQLTEEHQLRVRTLYYRGLVVDFAFMQLYLGEEFPSEVARVDCRHGEVHVHQFVRSGRQVSRTVLAEIPERDPWKTVDDWFYTCNEDWCRADEWERRYRTWERS